MVRFTVCITPVHKILNLAIVNYIEIIATVVQVVSQTKGYMVICDTLSRGGFFGIV